MLKFDSWDEYERYVDGDLVECNAEGNECWEICHSSTEIIDCFNCPFNAVLQAEEMDDDEL